MYMFVIHVQKHRKGDSILDSALKLFFSFQCQLFGEEENNFPQLTEKVSLVFFVLSPVATIFILV